MAALVRHFGDEEDAGSACGHCDVCNPADAVLRLFRRATAEERRWVQDVIEALRPATYKTVKQLMNEFGWAERLGRDGFEELLGAMLREGLIASEEAEFEKDGRVISYRKLSLTEVGLETRATTPVALLFADGIVEEFGGAAKQAPKKRGGGKERSVGKAEAPVELTGVSAELASRLKEWRAAEAKKLRVPAYVVMHDRTLNAVAAARPGNPRQLLDVDGMGPAKVERFGEAILELCAKVG